MTSPTKHAEPTIIQSPSGERYVVHSETPEDAARRLSRRYLVQRLGNVVRVVRELKVRGERS